MASQAAIQEALKALRGLAEANRSDFQIYPELVVAYENALESGRFRYVADLDTCGLPDCWSTFRALYYRYPLSPMPGDCEDFAAAHAAYFTVKGVPALIGLRPGKYFAHAVCAEGDQIPPRAVIDPSVGFGMKPLASYDGIHWIRVRPTEPSKEG